MTRSDQLNNIDLSPASRPMEYNRYFSRLSFLWTGQTGPHPTSLGGGGESRPVSRYFRVRRSDSTRANMEDTGMVYPNRNGLRTAGVRHLCIRRYNSQIKFAKVHLWVPLIVIRIGLDSRDNGPVAFYDSIDKLLEVACRHGSGTDVTRTDKVEKRRLT